MRAPWRGKCEACTLNILHGNNVRGWCTLVFPASTFYVCGCYWHLHCEASWLCEASFVLNFCWTHWYFGLTAQSFFGLWIYGFDWIQLAGDYMGSTDLLLPPVISFCNASA